jgi:hypothetical protein
MKIAVEPHQVSRPLRLRSCRLPFDRLRST